MQRLKIIAGPPMRLLNMHTFDFAYYEYFSNQSDRIPPSITEPVPRTAQLIALMYEN